MPTFTITGKRQQTITAIFVCDTEEPAIAIAEFKRRHAGVTGIKARRTKDVTVISAEPIVDIKEVAKEKLMTLVGAKKKAAKK